MCHTAVKKHVGNLTQTGFFICQQFLGTFYSLSYKVFPDGNAFLFKENPAEGNVIVADGFGYVISKIRFFECLRRIDKLSYRLFGFSDEKGFIAPDYCQF